MGNPYYIPRSTPSLGQSALSLADLGIRYHGIKERSRLEEGRQKIAKSQLDETKRVHDIEYGTDGKPGLAQQRIDIANKANKLEEDKLKAKGMALGQFKSQNLIKPKAILNNADLTYKIHLSRAVYPAMKILDDIADSGATNKDAYNALRKNWENVGPVVMQNLQEEYNKAYSSGNNAGAKIIFDTMADLKDDGVIDKFFPGVAQHIANEQAELEAKKTPYSQTKEGVLTIERGKNKRANIYADSRRKTGKDMTTELRQQDQAVAKAEKKIIEDGDVGQIDIFNKYGKKPYAYIVKPGQKESLFGLDILWPDKDAEFQKIDLPKYNGKQVFAADVYRTMVENDMTFEEVLRAIGAIK